MTIDAGGPDPSLPYVALTVEAMAAFGVEVDASVPGRYRIASGQRYQGRPYRIEGDVSSASYFFLAAALTGGRVQVTPIALNTRQGDIAFLKVLERLGCRVLRGEGDVEVTGGALPSGEMTFEMAAMPSWCPLGGPPGPAAGPERDRGVANLRIKESGPDRALVAELSKTGIRARSSPTAWRSRVGSPRGAMIETYQDHRIAMSSPSWGWWSPGCGSRGSSAWPSPSRVLADPGRALLTGERKGTSR